MQAHPPAIYSNTKKVKRNSSQPSYNEACHCGHVQIERPPAPDAWITLALPGRPTDLQIFHCALKCFNDPRQLARVPFLLYGSSRALALCQLARIGKMNRWLSSLSPFPIHEQDISGLRAAIHPGSLVLSGATSPTIKTHCLKAEPPLEAIIPPVLTTDTLYLRETHPTHLHVENIWGLFNPPKCSLYLT